MALSSDGFMITVSELLLESRTSRRSRAAYGGKRQHFNQLHCCRQIICVAEQFKGHTKSGYNVRLRERVCVLGLFFDPSVMFLSARF